MTKFFSSQRFTACMHLGVILAVAATLGACSDDDEKTLANGDTGVDVTQDASNSDTQIQQGTDTGKNDAGEHNQDIGGGETDDAGQNDPDATDPVDPVDPSKTACDRATGPVLEVGPDKTYKTISAAAAASKDGDVIKIAAGEYRGDVAYWGKNNLTICGEGGRARLFADGKHSGGKATWVVGGSNIVIDSIEFHKSVVPDKNGAGIRVEHKTGDLRIINCGFYDNQNGILTTAGPITLTVERSEFARNSDNLKAGQAHNIYVGGIDKVTVSASYFHEAKYGHNFKSRAKVSIIENSYLMDGPTGAASYVTDFPNGGKVILRGNMLHEGPQSENRTAIAYGQEGKKHDENSLEMTHNTVVITRPNSTFLRVQAWADSVTLTGNVFASTNKDQFITGTEFPLASIVQNSNVFMPASHFAGATHIAAPNFWPDAAGLALMGVSGIPVASYTHDSPAPYVLRPITGTTRYVGALQSAP